MGHLLYSRLYAKSFIYHSDGVMVAMVHPIYYYIENYSLERFKQLAQGDTPSGRTGSPAPFIAVASEASPSSYKQRLAFENAICLSL